MFVSLSASKHTRLFTSLEVTILIVLQHHACIEVHRRLLPLRDPPHADLDHDRHREGAEPPSAATSRVTTTTMTMTMVTTALGRIGGGPTEESTDGELGTEDYDQSEGDAPGDNIDGTVVRECDDGDSDDQDTMMRATGATALQREDRRQ